MVLVNLFLSFLKTGLFAIGGAYSFLPLIEKEVVEKFHWLTQEEFLDVLGIAKIFPGAISIKYATYTGYRVAGFPGAIAANMGNLLGPMALVIMATGVYAKYKHLSSFKGAFDMIQLAAFAMIIAVAFKVINFEQLVQFRSLLIIATCFVLFAYTKIHPASIIISAGLLGAVLNMHTS